MVYKPNRPYVNKKGQLILGDGIKKRLKTKRWRFSCLLGPIINVASAIFGFGKIDGKKWQNHYGKMRYIKTRKIT